MPSLTSSPTLHDFAVVLCRYGNESFHRVSEAKWKEWNTFVRLGGIGIVTDVDETIQRYASVLTSTSLRLNKLRGRQIHWTRGTYLFEALKQRECDEWLSVVPRSEEPMVNVLGRNEAGDAVAFEVCVGRGHVVFLPRFDPHERELLIPALLRAAIRVSVDARSAVSVPDWAIQVPLRSEALLTIERERLDTRLKRLGDAKSILSSEGVPLSRECHKILNEILSPEGFEVRYVESSGGHDIEVLGSAVTVVVEIKASTDSVKVGAARQLMDHAHQFPAKTQRISGLLVANAYRSLPPSQRPASFTATCLQLIERQQYCAMTTIQLLDLYDAFVRRDLGPGLFIQSITSSVGLFRGAAPSWALPEISGPRSTESSHST